MAKLTMTVIEVMTEMRKVGIHCNARQISDGIAMGVYPFGRVSNVGSTGRKTLEIFRIDFDAWLASKTPAQTQKPSAEPLRFVHNM